MASPSILIDNRIRIPKNVFDLPSFRRWALSDAFPQEGRISFLDGQLEVDMSPEEVWSHVDPKSELLAVVWRLVRERDLGKVYGDGARLTNEASNISNMPDLMLCSWETLESKRVAVQESIPDSGRCMEIVGTPDLVVEIDSKNSVRKDTRVLKKKYFTGRITEYWLIDAKKKEIDFQIMTRGEGGFEPVPPDRRGFRTSTALPFKFKLVRQRDRIGTWDYTLQHASPK